MNLRARIARHWTRRRLILALLGVMWMVYGVGVLTAPPSAQRFGDQIAPFDRVLNAPWSGVMWVAAGAISLICSTRRGNGAVTNGYGAVIAPAIVWMALYTWSLVTWWWTHGEYGSGRAWVAATTQAALVTIIFIVAGMADPPTDPDPGAHEDSDGGDRWTPPSR